jgi:hypothetical protein
MLSKAILNLGSFLIRPDLRKMRLRKCCMHQSLDFLIFCFRKFTDLRSQDEFSTRTRTRTQTRTRTRTLTNSRFAADKK